MKRSLLTQHLAALAILLATLSIARSAPPNILLIVADDLRFSDIGCYGGEIATPNLDALASEGLRFTQFYNTARCWPSRAAILTGYYAQQVRRDAIPGVKSGTLGTRPAWAPLLPAMLRPLGYRSYHSGKWHLDGKPLTSGFDRSYRLEDHDRYFAPDALFEDDQRLPAVATNAGYYATTAIAEHAIRCLKDHATNYPTQPFFEFLAFTAPHFPVQAPADDVARYRDRYVPGWDVMRTKRWEKMRGLGIGGNNLSPTERELGPPYPFPEALAKLGPNEVNRPIPWPELSSAQQQFQAAKMAVHAAMVDRMDREIGRVIDQLRTMGALENTLILFLSDNGASAEMMIRGDGHDPEAACGTGATFLSIGPGWSTMANTPFRRHKTWVHEGGISTPLIARWGQGIKDHGALRQTPGHVIDLVPTILELAGNPDLNAQKKGESPSRPGMSLVPLFSKDGSTNHASLWWWHEENRALRVGNWKIVAAGKASPWELYDLTQDRSESKNLAQAEPARVAELAARWQRETDTYTAQALKDLANPYSTWKHSGSLFILTDSQGAQLPESATVAEFPLLVRLNGDSFPFQECSPGGEDLRFSDAAGHPLAYQIETWDPTAGIANIWVRIPEIRGNSRQEIRAHWGKPDAISESQGSAVFNTTNGYLSVWHLSGSTIDEVGTLPSKETGTTSVRGIIGEGKHLAGGEGIFGGDKISSYPSGGQAHSSEAWFRATRPNTTILGWGNEGGGRGSKVRMQLRSPPHLHIDSDFSDVKADSPVPLSEWIHVVHTYTNGEGRIYINGHLDGAAHPTLNIKSPSRLWLGGWYDNYDFVGDLDEVRISNVARSPEWIQLQYENQKPLQTVTGPIVVRPEVPFSISPTQATVLEGDKITLSAVVQGAQKVYWTLQRGTDSPTAVVAVDRSEFTFEAGRVTSNSSANLSVIAIYPNITRTQSVTIAIQEAIPEPRFSLKSPARWDGRTPIPIEPEIANLEVLKAKGADKLRWSWKLSGIAVTHEMQRGGLILQRGHKSGEARITATADNGGDSVSQTITVQVTEPAGDPWIARSPEHDEQPVDHQFYARDDRNEGTLFWNGTLSEAADSVFLRVFAEGQPYRNESQQPGPGRSYAFTIKLKPGLVHYTAILGVVNSEGEAILKTVTNLVCGDAYLINGQSNAVSTDWGDEKPTYHSEWIRSYGSMSGDPAGVRLWGEAVHRGRENENLQIGYWGMEMARRLLEAHQIPICILNGAVGGTRIDQHQRDPKKPADRNTIYGRLLWRVHQARLSHGIRGILWHQGENDQGADGPSGGYGWETYRENFIAMASGWKQDFPNVQNLYVFQIWPKSCAMGIRGSDNQLREVQRTLPTAFSQLSVMSTLGVEPPGGCHFPAAGYADIARLITPLVERDNYGAKFQNSITAPNLVGVSRVSGSRDELVLEFDQPVVWRDELIGEFLIDGQPGTVASGRTDGSRLLLKMKTPGNPKTVSYLDSTKWSQSRLLRGANGIAALTFWNVPLSAP